MRITSPPIAFLVIGALAALLGCADPAADKPAAEVSAPTEEAPSLEGGVEFIISADSTVGFTGSKVTGSHDGGFTAFEGSIQVQDGDPTRSAVEIMIDTTSLWADNPKLTDHLKSADFFDVENHPQASFKSTAIAATDEGYTVTGNLDLHGVSKSISFPASILVDANQVSAEAVFSIKRFDFGIEYKGKADDLIRDDVVIRLNLQAARPADAA